MKNKLITIGAELYLVEDADGKRKWITKDEMLADIFNDSIFSDIK